MFPFPLELSFPRKRESIYFASIKYAPTPATIKSTVGEMLTPNAVESSLATPLVTLLTL